MGLVAMSERVLNDYYASTADTNKSAAPCRGRTTLSRMRDAASGSRVPFDIGHSAGGTEHGAARARRDASGAMRDAGST